MYLDVADRAATDLTFVIKQLKEEMYSCLDRFDVVTNLNRNSVSNDLQDNLENISNWSFYIKFLVAVIVHIFRSIFSM